VLVIVWEFRPRAERRAEFVTAYGPRGNWAQLFQRAEGWTNRAAYDSFRNRFSAEYAALDAACEEYTVHEERVGEFELLNSE
jgi:hypothetical protein